MIPVIACVDALIFVLSTTATRDTCVCFVLGVLQTLRCRHWQHVIPACAWCPSINVLSIPELERKMSLDTCVLLRGQTDLHGRIARAFENLNKLGASNITLGAVESRLHQLDSNWRKFEKSDDYIRSNFWVQFEKIDYIVEDFAGQVKESYLQVRAQFADYLQQMRTDAAKDASMAFAAESASPRTSMPKIQLPEFSGNFEDWPAFVDMFKTMVIENESLSAVQRMHYLKTTVKGEAERLIRCFTSTGDNFDRAWNALTEHYQNRRLLVASYCSEFLSLRPMKREAVDDLRCIYHGMRSAFGSLESIGRPIFTSPDLFIHLVVNLLDSTTRREWEATSDTILSPLVMTT